MLQKPFWRKTVAMLLSALILFTVIGAAMDTAVAEVTDDSETVDYVLILDCTVKAVDADKEGVRKAAAKMFVDLLPVDNARVAVFKIGARDANAQNNRPDAARSYKLRADENHMSNALYRMQCIYQLWDFEDPVSTITDREKLKSIIDEAYVQRMDENNCSDIHCAVYAAIDTLKYWNSSNACILLVSEEFTASYNKHLVVDASGREVDSDHTMWEDVQNALLDHRDWIMNWVDLGSDTPAIRSTIDALCMLNKGEACYDFGISQLPKMIATIVSKYTGSEEEGRTQFLDASGNAVIEMPDFIMLTEANVVVTGDGVEKVTVTDGRGSRVEKPKDDIWFSTNYDPQDRTHFLYSAVKMIRPASGDWTINVKGRAGTQVYVQTIQTLEPDIKLACNVRSGQNIGVGEKLNFTATYQYGGEDLHCGNDAYTHYLKDAKLYYTHSSNPDKKVDISDRLRVESEQYVADFSVKERGTYTFCFYVKSNDFKSGIRHANSIENITVENHAPVALGRLDDINDVPVGKTLEGAVNVGGLFSDQDNETLVYTVECKKDGRPYDLQYTLEKDMFMTIVAPEQDGEYNIEISAMDTNGAWSEVLAFRLRTVNQPPQLLHKSPYKIKMVTKAPKALVSLGLLSKKEGSYVDLNVDELFVDPDNLPMTYSLDTADTLTKDGKQIVNAVFSEKTGKVMISALRKGQATLYLQATDSAGAAQQIQLICKVRSTAGALFARCWWVLALLLLLAAAAYVLMISRRVRGSWTVDVEDLEHHGSCVHDFKSLAAAKDKMLRKTKVSLLSMAKAAAISEQVQDNIKLKCLPADAVVFHGSLSQGKTVNVSCSPRARVAIAINETTLTARKQYKLNRRDELIVTCKDADNEEILIVRVSFR